MTDRSNPGVAILLAILLFAPLSATCASVISGSSQPAHSCCPSTPPINNASAPRCCVISGIPNEPPALFAFNSIDSIPPAPHQAPAGIAPPNSVAAARFQPSVSRTELFIRFHQFLI